MAINFPNLIEIRNIDVKSRIQSRMLRDSMKRNAERPESEEKFTMASSQAISGPWCKIRETEMYRVRKRLKLTPFFIT